MRQSTKSKHIVLNRSDGDYEITILDKKTDEIINIKVTYTDKGFGLQVFPEQRDDYERDSLIVIHDSKGYDTDYVGIWKLKETFRQKMKSKYFETSHKFGRGGRK